MAATVPMLSAVFLVMFLLKMESGRMGFAASPASINIHNLIDGEPIQVTCEAFPEKTLRYGEFYGWGFSYSAWGYTKWSCFFKWGAKVQYFVVWVDPAIKSHEPWKSCYHCEWLVGRNGFSLISDDGRVPPHLIYLWF